MRGVTLRLQCKHPGHLQLDYQQIRLHTNNTFVLQARSSTLSLKGQMLPTTVQLPGMVKAQQVQLGHVCRAPILLQALHRMQQHSRPCAAACIHPPVLVAAAVDADLQQTHTVS